MTTHPLTGNRYPARYFDMETVDTLLEVANAPCPAEVIAVWSPQQRQAAGDWALRVHLRASDNLVSVPAKPEHVKLAEQRRDMGPDTGTVMDIVAGRKRS